MGIIFVASLGCLLFWAVPLRADCSQPVAQNLIEDFLKDPHSLLVSSPQGGEVFVRRMEPYASANADTLKAIVAIVPDTDLEQRKAIGTALGRVAVACSSRRPEISRRIAVAIRGISDDEVTHSYDRATGVPVSLYSTKAAPAHPPETALGANLSYPFSRKALELQDPLRSLRPY